jgi:hypothetical protein
MAALQGRVGIRSGMGPAREEIVRDVSTILRPMLVASLFPCQFSGTLCLSIHFKDGIVCHIRQTDIDQITPGAKQDKPRAACDSKDIDSVLQSAMVDLRAKLTTIARGYFGIVTLTIDLDAGICRKVSWQQERIYRRNE